MKTCTLERRFFKVGPDGVSEFDWLLSQLGVPEKEWEATDEIEVMLAD